MTQDEALTILKTGANVFLTGEPGSGKTYTINRYIQYLRDHGIPTAITASTGIAATHVGGMTVHSWSGIGIKHELTEQDIDEMETREPLVKRVNSAKVLIIDEVSMLPGRVLNLVDQACRALRKNEDAFGGLQVIFVGDFFQLPPIARRDEAPAQFAFDASSWKRSVPIVCYLSEQHRQEDQGFLSLLGAIRRGDLEDYIYTELGERGVDPEERPEGIPELHTHNIDVDMKNSHRLGLIEKDVVEFRMTTQGRPALVEHLKKGCLSPELLLLKEGASVMFTKNNFDGGYVNGTLGEVDRFDTDTGLPVVITHKGEEIKVSPAEWSVEDNGKVLAKITQIPLRLAWAITVHKSQGMSMDAAIMDLSRAFEYGQGYVALSRVRTLSGIHLLGLNQRALEVHPLVLERDESFRTSSNSAETAFGEMQKEEIKTLHENFITAVGGSLKKKAYPDQVQTIKLHTHEETLRCVMEKKTINEIATLRGLKEKTIFDHLEILLEKKRVSLDMLRYLISPTLEDGLTEIHETFHRLKTDRLTPVFEALNERYSFEDLRIARFFLLPLKK